YVGRILPCGSSEASSGCRHVQPLPVWQFKPLRCLVLGLGGGNETAQNRRQRRKNTTPQDVEAPQCAKDSATSQLFRCRSARAKQCSRTRTERGAGAADGDLGGAEGHKLLARKS